MQVCYNNTVWKSNNNVNEFPNSGDRRGRLINKALMMALSFTEIIVIGFITLPSYTMLCGSVGLLPAVTAFV